MAIRWQQMIRWAFARFYREFAWTYDTVAAVVSWGHWQAWVRSVLPLVHGQVLELGCGPGTLQQALAEAPLPLPSIALDASAQMLRLARRRAPHSRLLRADARWIPLPTAAFDTVVATFPSEYIADQRTLSEIRRVLRPSGELIVVLGAQLSGPLLYQQLIAMAYRIVLLTPPSTPASNPVDLPIGQSPLVQALRQAGFVAEARWHPSDGGAVFLIRATRSAGNTTPTGVGHHIP
jgi:ubiquinone/menaquinone biosynthesis C-methylase UbiE